MFQISDIPEHDATTSVWKDLTPAKSDPVFGLIHFYLKDENPKKVLLGVGAYRGDDGKPLILDTVKKAEQRILDNQVEKEYAFPDGYPAFRQASINLSYGKNHPAILADRVASAQTISGTGALRLGFDMLRKYYPSQVRKVYIPNVTWSLHHNIILDAGFEEIEFRYYNKETKRIDIKGMLEDLDSIEDEQILLIQTSCQNPSGVDPTRDEWQEILDVVKRKRHFVFFDSAYQGYGSDNIDDDTYSLKLFSCQYHRVMLANSFSKNFGLYGERAGSLSLICTSKDEKEVMQTRLKDTILPLYSNPPIHGAKVVHTILDDESLRAEWLEEVKMMANRLKGLRQTMVDKLKEKGSMHDWTHITDQIGMFAYTGLKEDMVQQLWDKYSIYMPFDGRISIASVNSANVDYICDAFHAVSHEKEI